MSTYRTGRHWGVTIVREGVPYSAQEGNPPAEDDELVAVVVNGDRELAERICALLNGDRDAWSLLTALVDPDPCHFDHHGYCQAHGLHSAPCPHQVAKELLHGREDRP